MHVKRDKYLANPYTQKLTSAKETARGRLWSFRTAAKVLQAAEPIFFDFLP